MSMLTLIIALSTFMWYVIDKFKDLWSGFNYSKYVTIAVSAICAFGLTFGFGLDIIYALNLMQEPCVAGMIVTAFTLMSGSAAVAEIMQTIQFSGQ